jgi:hypothetical protein
LTKFVNLTAPMSLISATSGGLQWASNWATTRVRITRASVRMGPQWGRDTDIDLSGMLERVPHGRIRFVLMSPSGFRRQIGLNICERAVRRTRRVRGRGVSGSRRMLPRHNGILRGGGCETQLCPSRRTWIRGRVFLVPRQNKSLGSLSRGAVEAPNGSCF